jgi:hypothetical protein
MKFLSGFIVGVLATILLLFLISLEHDQDAALKSTDSLAGLTRLPEKGKCIIKSEVEIFQTLKPNVALARSRAHPDEVLALLVNFDGDVYYDGQRIKMPSGKCARQIGTYQYETKGEFLKTVPAVAIE